MLATSFLEMRKLFFVTFLVYASVHAWDTGPSKCSNSECSGGTSKTVALLYTSLAFDTWTPIHRLADCPEDLKNDGFVCKRKSDEFDAPSHKAIPLPGFENRLYHGGRKIQSIIKTCSTVNKKYNCPSGFYDMGCFCLRGAAVGRLSCNKDHFCDKNRGRCYRRCPKYYVNTGESCYKPPNVVGPALMTCRPGELKYNTYCFPKKRTCPVGYTIWGSRCTRCYRNCPAGWFRSDVATCALRLRWRGNTHLWIMKRSLELLRKDVKGKRAYDHIMKGDCEHEWRAALHASTEYYSKDSSLDAHTHFYNPVGKDYHGAPTTCKTYHAPGKNDNEPNGYDSINTYLKKIPSEGCEAFGKALHHAVDLTMPFHTSGFGPFQTPNGLLAALEAYVPFIQKRYIPKVHWDKRWSDYEPLGVVNEMARRSNLLFAKKLIDELLKVGPVCKMNPPLCYQSYTGYCFANDPKVDNILGESLRDAYHSVASWIYAVCNHMNFKW